MIGRSGHSGTGALRVGALCRRLPSRSRGNPFVALPNDQATAEQQAERGLLYLAMEIEHNIPKLAANMANSVGDAPEARGSGPPLVGRAAERVLLSEQLRAAQSGRGNVVIIGGEAGIGKTTIARDLATQARAQGCVVVAGHCYDIMAAPPYGLWLDLADRYRHPTCHHCPMCWQTGTWTRSPASQPSSPVSRSFSRHSPRRDPRWSCLRMFTGRIRQVSSYSGMSPYVSPPCRSCLWSPIVKTS